MIDERPINESHQYNTQFLGWIVEEPINGGTDCYVLAAFEYEHDAKKHTDALNADEPDRDLAYTYRNVGTRYRDASGNPVAKQEVAA